jgi:hypothetical protein
MTATLHREATALRFTSRRGDLYDKAYRAALDAKGDWPAMLGYAETLSHSPLPAHTSLARHLRTSYSLQLAGLLKPVDPAHRDRSDMVDLWKASALEPRPETSRVVLMGMRDRWGEIIVWGALGALALLWATGWLA